MPRVAKAKPVVQAVATKALKTAKVSKAVKAVGSHQDTLILPELNPRDPDTKYTGSEPIFNTQPDRRQEALITGFNWYGRFYDRKMAKQQLVRYAQERKQGDVRLLQRAPEDRFIMPICWLARMSMRGLVLNERETARVNEHIATLQALVKPEAEAAPTVKPTNRPNVQEIMRDRAQEAGGELEAMFDGFITDGKPGIDDVPVIATLTERKIMPQHVSALVEVWRARRAEFEAVQTGKDAQLKEGYGQYTKMGIRNIIKFCDAVIAGLNSYVTVKRSTAKPRVRKPVSPERQASKVKYLKFFKDAQLKLDISSIQPSKIIGATEVWAYDTARRKLWYLVADQHIGTLAIKGTTILGLDLVQSGVKTLRKPGEVLKQLMAAGKPAARKLFKEINAVQAQPKGRTNEALVILKAY